MGYGGFGVCHCSSLHRKKGCVGELEWNAARVCHEGFGLRDEDSHHREREVRISLTRASSALPRAHVNDCQPLLIQPLGCLPLAYLAAAACRSSQMQL